jgi:hypothetical protein
MMSNGTSLVLNSEQDLDSKFCEKIQRYVSISTRLQICGKD